MHRDESEETVAQLAGGWLEALRTGHTALNSTADSPGSCMVSAIDTETKSRVPDDEWQAERSMDALSRFLDPENANNSRSQQNAIFQPRSNRAEDGVERFSSIRADLDNSVSPAISSLSPTDMSVNVAATMHLSHPAHAINAVSSALAHSAPRRLSLVLAAAANLSSSRCSLPSSTSTESLSLLSSNRNTSPILRPPSHGHLNYRSHLSRTTKMESGLSTGLDGGETLSRQSSESVTSPTVEGADNTTTRMEFLSDSNKDDRNGYFHDSEPLPPQRNRSNSSHDIAIFLSQGLPQRINPSINASPSKKKRRQLRRPSQTELDIHYLNPPIQPQLHQQSSLDDSPQSPLKRSRPSRTLQSTIPTLTSTMNPQFKESGAKSCSNIKSYPCLVPGCNKVFPRAYNLKSHSYCHSGERPHKCHSCTASFSRKHDLQRHVRTLHARDRPHVCSQCDQAFLTLDQLRRHIVTSNHREDSKNQPVREESRAHRRSSMSTNAGSLDAHAEQLPPRNQLLEESLATESLGSITRTDSLSIAAAAADWIHSSSSTTRLQDLPSTQPSILNASFNARSTIVEFADGGIRGINEPTVHVPGMDGASFENALRKRRASGTTGGSIGVLALAAEAELQRQIARLQSNEVIKSDNLSFQNDVDKDSNMLFGS